MEKKYRTATKIILWRVITFAVTITVLQIYTNNINISLSLGLIDHSICLVMHYFYERFWSHISWGMYTDDKKKDDKKVDNDKKEVDIDILTTAV